MAIDADLVDCMVAPLGQLSYSTQIPTCLRFLARDKSNRNGAADAAPRGKPAPGSPQGGRWFRDPRGHVLTSGCYVGAEAQEADGEPFEEKMKRLVSQLPRQQAEAAMLDTAIAANLKELGYGR